MKIKLVVSPYMAQLSVSMHARVVRAPSIRFDTGINIIPRSRTRSISRPVVPFFGGRPAACLRTTHRDDTTLLQFDKDGRLTRYANGQRFWIPPSLHDEAVCNALPMNPIGCAVVWNGIVQCRFLGYNSTKRNGVFTAHPELST